MKSKWVAAVLITSLVLNLLLIGFLIGKRGGAEMAGDPTRYFPRWVRTLPEPRREVLSPLIRNHMRSMRPSLRSLREEHRNLRAAIKSEPFDPELLRAALAAMRAQNEQVQTISHNSFIDFVAKLDANERRQLAEDVGHQKPQHGPRPKIE